MSPRFLWTALALGLLTGCDVEFIAIERGGVGLVVLESRQRDSLEVLIDFVLPADGAPPRVAHEGRPLRPEQQGGRWHYNASLTVDSLHPRVELTIEGDDRRVIVLPLLMRNGPAVWRDDGDLELPLVFGGQMDRWNVLWGVSLIDSMGAPLLSIESPGAALPHPLLIPGDLIPAGAVAAQLRASLNGELEDAVYPLRVGIYPTVHIPVRQTSGEGVEVQR
jgi:hypothetical protein